MSTCRFCAKLRRWFGLGPEYSCEALWHSHWAESDAWERAQSNDYELWLEDSDEIRALNEAAHARQAVDPEAALQTFLETAEAGSAWALAKVGWHYETGTVVAADYDQAEDYYYRAICAGSWMATIAYARLLADHGHVEQSEAVLQDGVSRGFLPAYYWLAWLRYERAPTGATCREIRPFLDYAAGWGHPGAKLTLGRLMMKGRFGALAIPRGLKLLWETRPQLLRTETLSPEGQKVQALIPAAQN